MRWLNYFVLMLTFIFLAVYLDNDAYFWAALMVSAIQMAELILFMSED